MYIFILCIYYENGYWTRLLGHTICNKVSTQVYYLFWRHIKNKYWNKFRHALYLYIREDLDRDASGNDILTFDQRSAYCTQIFQHIVHKSFSILYTNRSAYCAKIVQHIVHKSKTEEIRHKRTFFLFCSSLHWEFFSSSHLGMYLLYTYHLYIQT